MTLQPGGPAPYTSPTAAIAAIEAFRERALPSPVDADALVRLGVSESIAPRTLNSLKQLGLLHEDGRGTETLELIRVARGPEEYRKRLTEWLKTVYADVIQYADPSRDSADRVVESFRTYEPAGQRRAMAALMLGLWKHAGLAVGEASPKSRPVGPKPVAPPRSSIRRERPTGGERKSTTDPATGLGTIPEGLVGLLQQIPASGHGWSKQRRDAFIAAFGAVLDFSVPIQPDDLATTPEIEGSNP